MPNVLANVIQGFTVNGAIHYGELPSVDFEIVSVLEKFCKFFEFDTAAPGREREYSRDEEVSPPEWGSFSRCLRRPL
jgi:hypothetical protein